MAISYINSQRQTSGSLVNSFTMTIDVGTGPDRALVLALFQRNSVIQAVSAITYNGVAMSAGPTITYDDANDLWIQIFYLLNPSSGSNTLSVTFGGNTVYECQAAWFTGVDQVASPDDTDIATGNSTTPSVTLVPTSGNALGFAGVIHERLNALTTGSGENALFNNDNGAWVTSTSYAIISSSNVFDWTATAADTWAAAGILLKEASASNTPPATVLNTADSSSFSTGTPTLEATATDDQSDDVRYKFQISTSPTFESGTVLKDNYNPASTDSIFHPNPSNNLTWQGNYQVDDRVGQSFTGNGGTLEKIRIKFGSDTSGLTDGNVLIRVYNEAHATAFGTDSTPANPADPADTPTPGWIALSQQLYVDNTKPTAPEWTDITFTGDNRIKLVSGQKYIFIIDWIPNPSAIDYDNTIRIAGSSLLGHSGNMYIDGESVANNGVYSPSDLAFEVHESFTLLEKISGTDAGFTNTVTPADTDPFNSGEKVSFTVQAGDALPNNGYYWRVQATDPAGSTLYGDWTASRTFTVSTSSTQTISPSNIAPDEAVGTPTITTGNVNLVPAGIASAEAFGSHTVSNVATTQTILPGGIASGEAFGSPTLQPGPVSVTPTGIPSGEAFGSATLTAGPVNIQPTGIASAEAFGSQTIATGPVSVAPTGIASAEAFGPTTLTTGPVNLFPTGIASGETFGDPVVSQGGVVLQPAGIASAEAFGGAQLTTGPVSVLPAGIPSAEVFGDAVVSAGGALLQPSGIPSAEAFGGAALSTGPVNIAPSGIASAEIFGDPVISTGAVVQPSGIGSTEAFGSANLSTGPVSISPSGIPSAEAIGDPVVSTGGSILQPSGIPSAEAFGGAVLTTGPVTVSLTGIPSAEAFGDPAVSAGGAILLPTGISSGEAFGNSTIATGAVSLGPTGISTAEAFGDAVLTTGPVSLQPSGIPSGEDFGVPYINTGQLVVFPSGISSGESFGSATVQPGPVVIVAEGIGSQETVSTPVVQTYTTITPSGIPSAEAFGTPGISGGAVTLQPAGIPSAEALGSPAISTGQVLISPAGIPSGEGFGSPDITSIAYIEPTGIPSGELFGTPSLTTGVATIIMVGIPSAESFGTAYMAQGIVSELVATVYITRTVTRDVHITQEISEEVGLWP